MKLELNTTDLVGLSAAVDAATRGGIFAALLQGGPVSPSGLCRTLGLDERGLGVVLEVLLAAGLLVRDGEGRVCAGHELAALEARMPGSALLAGALFAGTPVLLASGSPVTVMDGDARQRSEVYRGAVSGLAGMFAEAAEALAERLSPISGAILDVGCGSGVWGLALAARSPDTQLTGLDLPGVTDVFLRHAAEAGLAGRARAWPGDAHELALPDAAFDLAIVANVLRLETEARAQALVARVARSLRPGGRLAIVDALATGTTSRDVARAVYGLHLALRTRHGTVHAPERVRSWLAAAGLTAIEVMDLGAHPGAVAAIVGRASSAA